MKSNTLKQFRIVALWSEYAIVLDPGGGRGGRDIYMTTFRIKKTLFKKIINNLGDRA